MNFRGHELNAQDRAGVARARLEISSKPFLEARPERNLFRGRAKSDSRKVTVRTVPWFLQSDSQSDSQEVLGWDDQSGE